MQGIPYKGTWVVGYVQAKGATGKGERCRWLRVSVGLVSGGGQKVANSHQGGAAGEDRGGVAGDGDRPLGVRRRRSRLGSPNRCGSSAGAAHLAAAHDTQHSAVASDFFAWACGWCVRGAPGAFLGPFESDGPRWRTPMVWCELATFCTPPLTRPTETLSHLLHLSPPRISTGTTCLFRHQRDRDHPPSSVSRVTLR